ncbi:HAD-IA family hydrolase [uncultured Eubacterium sp.]|uniref:HAD family hydrolase n=1 Tax=uncultured Eubacterium sp. TaxID=165185 RepID=UPI0025CDDB36|nr:HAD-IA family hydrolase [uncultured Eubacterium sp.]
MTKAVLFDFDETLQDRTLAFEGYMDAFLDEYLPNISQKEREAHKQDMRITGNGGYVNRVEWCTNLVKMWGWENAPDATVLANHYDYNFGDFNVIFENSIPLLKELKARGYLTGVITNGPSVLQNHKMDTSGLRPYCDIVVVSGDEGVHKPDPRLFEITAERLGVKPQECVYVGDHPVNDIQGALSAGMGAIRMNFGWFKDKDLRPDVPVITDIIDVLKYV